MNGSQITEKYNVHVYEWAYKCIFHTLNILMGMAFMLRDYMNGGAFQSSEAPCTQ